MKRFEANYEKFVETEDLSGLKPDYEKLLANLNQPVRVLDQNNPYEGIARGINPGGELLVDVYKRQAATSVCVTGLSTVVMATQWSPIGKVVILCLIQIGGIGLIALANMIFISLRRKISLKNRRIIKESYNLDEMGGVVAVVRSCLLYTSLLLSCL